jgi:hypothetical protein
MICSFLLLRVICPAAGGVWLTPPVHHFAPKPALQQWRDNGGTRIVREMADPVFCSAFAATFSLGRIRIFLLTPYVSRTCIAADIFLICSSLVFDSFSLENNRILFIAHYLAQVIYMHF